MFILCLGWVSSGPYGENLAATSDGNDPITWGLNAWAEEAGEFCPLRRPSSTNPSPIRLGTDLPQTVRQPTRFAFPAADYDYSSGNPASGTGHFTQVRIFFSEWVLAGSKQI